MKKFLILAFIFASFSFARISEKHCIVSPPTASSFVKTGLGLVSAKDFIEEDLSIKWKRRHKRRKKSRGRQRGR